MGEQSLENRENHEELEFLEPEVKEFVRVKARQNPAESRNVGSFQKPARKSSSRSRRTARQGRHRRKSGVGNSCLRMVLLLSVVLSVAFLGLLWLKQPVEIVILVVVLEAALAVCMGRVPPWLHGAVIALNLVLGVIFGKFLFLLLANLVYLAEVLFGNRPGKR